MREVGYGMIEILLVSVGLFGDAFLDLADLWDLGGCFRLFEEWHSCGCVGGERVDVGLRAWGGTSGYYSKAKRARQAETGASDDIMAEGRHRFGRAGRGLGGSTQARAVLAAQG